MTQTRPRLDDDLAAAVQAYADANGITFTAATRILLRQALNKEKDNAAHIPGH
jgi:antitoxin component of RelBE/YafQ-DinJ toxin-antitoxin module